MPASEYAQGYELTPIPAPTRRTIERAIVFLSLALIGVAGGLITGISPCIIPVLPVIFLSGGAQSARAVPGDDGAPRVSVWRPYLVILGLVLSFSVFTLVGSLVQKSRLHNGPRVVRHV